MWVQTSISKNNPRPNMKNTKRKHVRVCMCVRIKQGLYRGREQYIQGTKKESIYYSIIYIRKKGVNKKNQSYRIFSEVYLSVLRRSNHHRGTLKKHTDLVVNRSVRGNLSVTPTKSRKKRIFITKEMVKKFTRKRSLFRNRILTIQYTTSYSI